jgi:hypothetical protein
MGQPKLRGSKRSEPSACRGHFETVQLLNLLDLLDLADPKGGSNGGKKREILEHS